MKEKNWIKIVFTLLVVLTLLTPFWVFKDLLFPFITSKAYYLRILVELTLPFYLYLVLSYKRLRPNLKNPLTISVLLFLFLNVISAAFGVNALRSFWGNFERMGGVFYLGHLVLLYFYVLLVGQIGQKYMRRFLEAVIWSAAAVTIDGILIKLTHNHFILNDPSYPRISGSFGNPIFIASFLILPMFLTVYYAFVEERRWLKAVYGAVVLMELYVILLSETRGAVVGIAVALFVAAAVYVLFNKHKQVRRWGGLGIAAFTILVVLAFTQHSKFPQGSMLYRVFNLKDSNTEARIVQWGVALKGYKDHPILGVGPEDYYFISNAYYNPAIYQYDASWFDKPHNYLIEVLVTTGALGFIAYAATLVFVVWSLALAYKKEFLSLLEFCLLMAGFLAYEFQNLFVFDTISASLMFFVFLGFAGFLWHECQVNPDEAKKKNFQGLPPVFVGLSTALVVLIMVYVIYTGNILGLRIAKDINYGYAYSGVDPQIGQNYFEAARSLPFDFDPIQFASKYADFATALAANPKNQPQQFVDKNLQNAIAVEQDAIARVPNDPTAWQELSNLYLTQAIFDKTGLSAEAMPAAQKAMDLAPKRPEPVSMVARLYLSENNTAAAEQLMLKLISDIPKDNEAKLQLAIMYAYGSQMPKALDTAQAVLDSGYRPQQASQIDWMAQAYDKENNFAAAAKIYEIAIQIEPGNLQDAWALAQDYAKLGRKADAVRIAQSLIGQDPADAQHFQDFINSLK